MAHKNQLIGKVEIVAKLSRRGFELDGPYSGGYRLSIPSGNSGGIHWITGRMKAGDMNFYLDGMINGLELNKLKEGQT